MSRLRHYVAPSKKVNNMIFKSLHAFIDATGARLALTKNLSARRKFMLSTLGAALAASSASIQAQTERKASAPASESLAGVDPSPATVEDLPERKRTAGAAPAESFKVTSRRKTSTVTVKPAEGKSGDAIVTIDGQEIRIRANSQFDIKKPPVGSTAKGSSDFWGCFVMSMISQIGQAAWNNIKNNYQSMWNSTSGKPFWKRIALFLKNIFTLTYGSYALTALLACK